MASRMWIAVWRSASCSPFRVAEPQLIEERFVDRYSCAYDRAVIDHRLPTGSAMQRRRS